MSNWLSEMYDTLKDKVNDFFEDPEEPPVVEQPAPQTKRREEFAKAVEQERLAVESKPVVQDEDSFVEAIMPLIEELEGRSNVKYRDKKGNLTIGAGVSATSGFDVENMTPEEVRQAERTILKREYNRMTTAAPYIEKLDQVRKKALATIAYNMGGRFILRFPSMAKYLRKATETQDESLRNQYLKKAAYELLHSRNGKPSQYFKDVGGRAQYVADIIAFGKPLASLDEYRMKYAGEDGHVDESKVKIPGYFK